MVLEQFIDYLKYERRFSAHTLVSYQNDVYQFEQFINSQGIMGHEFVGTEHIRLWVNQLHKQGITSASLSRKLASLRTFYKFLIHEEIISESPAEKIRGPKVAKKKPDFAPEKKMIELLEEINYPDGFGGKRDRIIMELLYNTGMRLSELIGLKFASVDIYAQTVKVLGKRNKHRVIPVGKTLCDMLADYITACKVNGRPTDGDQPLLVTDKGEVLYPMFVYRKVRNYLNGIAELERRSPHILRHTFATHLLENGADLNAIKELLGHANLAATQVYTHHSIDRLREVFKQAHPKAE